MADIKRERLPTEERKEQILEKSLEIIYQEGFSNLTIKNIANRIGISEPAIYRHFKDKHEIVDELANLAFRFMLTDPPNPKRCDPTGRLYSIVSQKVQELEKNPYLTAIAFQEEVFHEYPDIRAKSRRGGEQMEQAVMEIVRCGQKRGIFCTSVDAHTFALIYVGSMRMVVQKWRNSGFAYSLVAESKKIIDELFKLLKGTPRPQMD